VIVSTSPAVKRPPRRREDTTLVERWDPGRHPPIMARRRIGRVEDRSGAGLYLEMTDGPLAPTSRSAVAGPVADRRSRARDLVGEPPDGDRDDLPRKLPEFSYLAGLRGRRHLHPRRHHTRSRPGCHFRRTGRPGRDGSPGKPTIGLSLVLISPRSPDGARALRDWADFVHIRHIAEVAVPGYGMITPYEHADGADPATSTSTRWTPRSPRHRSRP